MKPRRGGFPGNNKNYITMAMKKVTSKREINRVLDNLVEVERSECYADCPKEYTYTSGTFRCTIDTYGTTLEEQKELLRHRANCLDRYGIITPAELNRRSKQMQLAMAFIGEHRELIPFLEYVSKRADKNKASKEYVRNLRNIPAVVLEYTQRSPRLSWWKKNNDDFPPLSCLLDELPRIPMAWRA